MKSEKFFEVRYNFQWTLFNLGLLTRLIDDRPLRFNIGEVNHDG